MAETRTFEWVCAELEGSSALDRLEARGTVRLALKQAGLEARSVTPAQMLVVLHRLLPDELDLRGVEEATGVCEMLASGLEKAELGDGETGRAPDAVFTRLGRS